MNPAVTKHPISRGIEFRWFSVILEKIQNTVKVYQNFFFPSENNEISVENRINLRNSDEIVKSVFEISLEYPLAFP